MTRDGTSGALAEATAQFVIALFGFKNLFSTPAGETAMQSMMEGMMGGPMMWVMGGFCLLIFVVLMLAAIALVKYLFFNSGHSSKNK